MSSLDVGADVTTRALDERRFDPAQVDGLVLGWTLPQLQGERAARVRWAGGGRRKLAETDPQLLTELARLVGPETRGDPLSLLVWTTKSTRHLAGALTQLGHPASARTVGRMLVTLGFSLQGNAKVSEGHQHADRDAQFAYLACQAAEHPGPERRWCRWTPRIRSWSGSLKTAGGSTSRPERRSAGAGQRARLPGQGAGQSDRTASTTCPPTPAGYRSALTTTPPRSRWPPCVASGTLSAPPATRPRQPAAGLRRWRRVEWPPGPGLESRTRRLRRRHRSNTPSATWQLCP